MGVLILVHPLLRRLYNTFVPANAPEDRFTQRTSFDLYFALVLLAGLHGFSALKILLILYINFQLTTLLPKAQIPAATWVFNVGILFLNEFCQGYRFAALSPNLALLDNYGGLIPRWEIFFKFTILRCISYNMDYYWSLDAPPSAQTTSHQPVSPHQATLLPTLTGQPPPSERERVSASCPPTCRSLLTYFSYTLYSPLYLAGPILTFNDYISQSRTSTALSPRRTALYGLRFVVALLVMEVQLHYIYAVAICSSSPDWSAYTPFQLSMLGYFNLHTIWLKLLILFRFFRLWSLVDDIDPPENVVRCMSDNYSTLSFWRGWHRSYNRWLVRYIYIPLGGGGAGGVARGLFNTLVIFTFVAVWHDINLRLLAWGWLITLFVLPEILAGLAFPAKAYKDRPTLYRLLCGVGAVGNILMMMAANLVGFAIGLDGLKGMVTAILGSWGGMLFLLAACSTLFVGAEVMFEIRESEKRQGIFLKF